VNSIYQLLKAQEKSAINIHFNDSLPEELTIALQVGQQIKSKTDMRESMYNVFTIVEDSTEYKFWHML
jgi:hypothetical protein